MPLGGHLRRICQSVAPAGSIWEGNVENIPAYINMLSYLFIVLHMLSVPLKTTRGEIIRTLGNLNLMGRALLANFVIIPILGVIIAHFLTYQRRSKPDFFCSV